MIDAGIARGDGNEGHTSVRRWKSWCHSHRLSPLRPLDPLTTTLSQKSSEVWVCLRFTHSLITDPLHPVSPNTSVSYLGTVNAWHARRCLVGLAAGASLAICTEMARGFARHTPLAPRPPRFGLPPQCLAYGMEAVLGPRGASPRTQNLRAGLAVCFSTMSRGCELFLRDGSAWQPLRDPLRGELQPSGRGYSVAVHEAKRCSLTGVAPGKRTRVYVPRGGSLLDPAAELDALLACDPASSTSPLFRGAGDAAVTVREIRDLVKEIARAAGLDPRNYGAHSLRRASPFGGAHSQLQLLISQSLSCN